ncbi:hypothetical protein LI811_002072 [Salmonella enterica]|nr:hypothetical protein [Salmonella enterica]
MQEKISKLIYSHLHKKEISTFQKDILNDVILNRNTKRYNLAGYFMAEKVNNEDYIKNLIEQLKNILHNINFKISALCERDIENELKILESYANEPFDYEGSTLIQCNIYDVVNFGVLVFIKIHHLIVDGFSLLKLMNYLHLSSLSNNLGKLDYVYIKDIELNIDEKLSFWKEYLS